ncbi:MULTISPECIES: agmatinase [Pseudomonas]|uniref:agmatinase n=1 Tax=Pseudomonas TaxID=286 RepID=UPI00164642A9|nr:MULTISPECIES: agmatinase [Pseudomonas]MBC3421900.1 agmatinase [Pseudomonas sp. RW3S2]MBC3456969.1 agmatinase [Pseudomonas mosselii]
MSKPTFSLSPTFLGVRRTDIDADYVIAGVPLDIATVNRGGAREAPSAIRRASRMLADGGHPETGFDPLNLALADAGDFNIALGEVVQSLELIEAQAHPIKHLIALGGDHGISLALLRALKKRLGKPVRIIHFDAHVDTWPDSFGQKYGHGSVFYNAIQEDLVDAHHFVQVGIRSPVQPEVLRWTLEQGVTILSAQTVHEIGTSAVVERIRQSMGTHEPVYLSFDIDALDPSYAPGTGTPEVGGLASWQVQAILRGLRGLNFVGMDMVEVAPPYDHAELTSLAAATIIWEYLCLQGPVVDAVSEQ